jgi:hypothetical protein
MAENFQTDENLTKLLNSAIADENNRPHED